MCEFCSMHAGLCDFGPLSAQAAGSIVARGSAKASQGKWGDPAFGSPGGVVTWSIAGGGIDISAFPANTVSGDPDAFFDADLAPVLREAMAIWSAAANIEFIQVEDGSAPAGQGIAGDIRVFLGEAPETSILGRAYFPAPGDLAGGDIQIAADERFNALSDAGTPDYLLYVLLHEVGHALGLPHDSAEGAVMHRQVPPEKTRTELDGRDTSAIVERYGAQDGAPMVYEMGALQEELLLVFSPEPLTVIGSEIANTIRGTEGVETVFGGAGDDIIETGAGDDVIAGGPGSEIVRGGPGFDRAEIAAQFNSADVALSAQAVALEGADGADRIEEVELLVFEDGVLALDLEGSGLGFVFRHYQAAFGREADGGVLFWQAELRAGLPEAALAEAFVASPEFAERYGDAPAPSDFVDALYLNVFGRGADDAGRAFWTGAFADGLPRAEMLSAFAESPENRALTDDTLSQGLFFAGTLDDYGLV